MADGLLDTVASSNNDPPDLDHTHRVCHTVLSYCDLEEEGENEVCTGTTQPLSMFSGEGAGEARDTQDIDELDDLLFPLDDPFSLSHSSGDSKLVDPLSKLDDPFSLTGDSLLEVDTDSVHEQRVPASPATTGLSEDEEEREPGGIEGVPRRQFKTHSSSRCYNLDLLPKHYRKGSSRKTFTVRTRPSVNWARDLSVVMRSKERETAEDRARGSLSVFEVPLSAGEDSRKRARQESTTGNTSRENRSKLDLSICSRTKEQQVFIE